MSTSNDQTSVSIGVVSGAILGIVVLLVLMALMGGTDEDNAPPLQQPSEPSVVAASEQTEKSTAAPPQSQLTAPSKTAEKAPSPREEVSPKTVASKVPNRAVDKREVEAIQKKLRMIALAMQNYASARRSKFPIAGGPDAKLSWRVHLLPYLEQGPLYKQFKLDEPWNGPTNSKLLSSMPDVYHSLSGPDAETRFMVFSGADTPFLTDKQVSIRNFTDGLSHTVLAVHAGATVPWTKPIDIEFSKDAPLANLEALNDRIHMVLGDVSPLSVGPDIDPATMTGLVTPSGGEVIDAKSVQRRYSSVNHNDPASFAAIKNETMNRFKQISLGMLNHESATRTFPPPWSWGRSKDRSVRGPAVSWRVSILPFVEQMPAYKKYDRSFEWNHSSNRSLLDTMPQLYRHASDVSSGETRVHVISGEGTAFRSPRDEPRARGIGFRQIKDGASKTLLFVEAGPETTSPWTQPNAIPYKAEAPLESLGTLPPQGFPASMADGSVRWITPDIDPEVFRSMVLTNDGK